MPTNFTTPVGRLVMGDLYKPQTTDAEGKPLVIKHGPNAGQPTVKYFFALAIPKGQEQHWSQTQWGAAIFNEGKTSFPQAHLAPTFAWKVVDGDSTVPNRQGVAPNTRQGYPGHWVVSFASSFAPKLYNRDGTQALTEPGAIKIGYYAQVNANVAGNGSQQQPGVFINHSMVALSGYGEEIVTGPNPASAGFGQSPLPAGASATPVGGFAPAPAPTQQGWQQAPAPAPAPSPAPAPAQIPPPPNPAVLSIPSAPVMTEKAAGATYEQMLAAGWTHDLLVQHGMIAQ